MWFPRLIGASLGAALAACSAGTAREEDRLTSYHQALGATADVEPPAAGSEAEKRAMERFVEFYEVYSVEHIEPRIRDLYAENAYFRDPFREVEGIEEIEPYFLRAAEAIDECRFEIQDVARSGNDHYFRWIMKFQINRDPEKPLDEAVGMSHVRFDGSGKVVFQQDYWDAATGVYEKFPVLGWVLRKIRRSM